MRILNIVLITFICCLLASCSLKESFDNGFKPETTIEPIASPTNVVAASSDNKVRIKIPLSESSIGYHDLEDILGDNAFRRVPIINIITEKLRLSFSNLAVRFGVSDKIKVSSYLDLPEIDPGLIKSAVVKKVFFTTEDCRNDDSRCNTSKKYNNNFSIIDKFFVNILSYDEVQAGDPMQIISDREFKAIAKKSFEQNLDQKVEVVSGVEELSLDAGESHKKDINLVKFSHIIPYLSMNSVSVDDNERVFELRFLNKDKAKEVSTYLKTDEFKDLIARSSLNRRNLTIYLRRNRKASELFERIEIAQNKNLGNMYIFRLNSEYKKAKDFFEGKGFKEIIKDSTMIGRSLFIEISDEKKRDQFLKLIDFENKFEKTGLDIHQMDRCINNNCIELEGDEFNLIPLLSVNPNLRIDTYVSLKSLGYTDFKYNGYIEVEIELNLPL